MTKYPEVCYEIFVRSFCDSNGDGIGDLNGITSKLDYLARLGVRGIWLTPIHPSPSYHKYDVTDYYDIDPEYGTLEDYRNLLNQAHRRGLKVYMDLVIHHTSIWHNWFEEARRDPRSKYRSYYRWMSDARINEMGVDVRELTQDAHTVNPWHKIKGDKERYLGVFSREMADLNFDNKELRSEVYKIADYWLNSVGVDGFRLDAARHIYPVWEDERNPVFWEEFGAEIGNLKPETYLVGEVWAEAARVAPFFKGLKANFNFDLWEKLTHILLREEDSGLVGWLQFQRVTFGQIAPGFVDAIMLSNHDQQRIGSTLGGNVAKMKLAAAILLTLPGQPYLYYGEEIGMLGRKPDPHLREPFLWGDEGQETFWKAPRYSKAGKVKTLRSVLADPASLYYCYQNLIFLRNRHPALGAVSEASIADSGIVHPGILTYIRNDGETSFLIVHNLTKTTQTVPIKEELSWFNLIRYATSRGYLLRKNSLRISGYHTVILERRFVMGQVSSLPDETIPPA